MIHIEFNRLRLLVIDDNPHMRRIIRTLLHGFGARDVFEAEDGATGLDAFTHNIPDIVLIDWAMPVFDGLELTKMIRQADSNANPFVPIIMITGHTEKNRVTAARDSGITEFLAKPISAKALYQRIGDRAPAALHQDQDLFRARSPAQHQSQLRRSRTAPRQRERHRATGPAWQDRQATGATAMTGVQET